MTNGLADWDQSRNFCVRVRNFVSVLGIENFDRSKKADL